MVDFRYVDRLKDSLKQTLTLADKMVFHEKEMVDRRTLAVEEETEISPKVSDLVKRTKIMQKQVWYHFWAGFHIQELTLSVNPSNT